MSSSVNAKHLLAMKLQLADNQNGDHLAMSDEVSYGDERLKDRDV
jgi:hypothetical protein